MHKKKKTLKKHPRMPKRCGSLKIVPRWIVITIFILCTAVLLAAAAAYIGYRYISSDLPKISTLKDYRPPLITMVYSDDGRKIAEFYKERRILVPLNEIPSYLTAAFIAAEDSRFFTHKGLDLHGILRAALKNIEAGAVVQGGSTITQQVTKSFLLTPERSFRRKLREAILAYRIDKTFTKEDILYLYLNQIYLGHGAYGVAAAAENYFGKQVRELSLPESAMLAGLPQAPSRYSPFRHPQKAKERQIYTLNRMVTEGYITREQADAATKTSLDIKPRRNWFMEAAPFYTEYIRQYIEKKYGPEELYKGGLQIHTAVDIEMQKSARKQIKKGLRKLDKRQGYRGPLKNLQPQEIQKWAVQIEEIRVKDPLKAGQIAQGVVIKIDDGAKTVRVRLGKEQGILRLADMKWARKRNLEVLYTNAVQLKRPGQALNVGDLIEVGLKNQEQKSKLWNLTLEQTPEAQSALLCIESQSGLVKAMIGGRDYKNSQFNRAIQARRQPGSAFKPVIYAAALDKGFTPASEIIDNAIVFKDEIRDKIWKPKNYEKRFYGPTLMRKALAHSRNLATIKILSDIGIDYVIEYAQKLGIKTKLSRDLSIALGSSGMSLLELVNAYSVFANQGQMVKPVFITKILDRHGNILEESSFEKEEVIDPATAYLMTSMLQSVVKEGTGRRVKPLGRPTAGKTGTTNNLHDAWFVGYTPQYIIGTWVGFDEEKSLGKKETGARAAIPIWLGFMQDVMADKPVGAFTVPENIVFTKIDAETGLLPGPETAKTIFECFKEGTVPTEQSPVSDIFKGSDNFFKNGM